MRDFEENFSDYLETYETDEMFNNFFTAIRKAYIAGYKAAGGKVPAVIPIKIAKQEIFIFSTKMKK